MKKQSENHDYIHKAITQGIYQNQPSFNQNTNNLVALIDYIDTMPASRQNMERAFKLIKFYRLPIVISFRHVYKRINIFDQNQQESLKQVAKEIATYVGSILEQAQVKTFDEISFIFQYGRGKKRYKFQISPPEIQFAQFVYELSKQKKSVLSKIRDSADASDQVNQGMSQLDEIVMKRKTNPFEKTFIDFIKENALNKMEKRVSKIAQIEQIQSLPIITAQKPKIQAEKKEIKPTILPTVIKSQQKLPSSSQKKIQLPSQKDIPFDEELPYQKEVLKPMCCRQYFLKEEIIEQSQNLKIQYKHYRYPFKNKPGQVPTKQQKIKRVLCGFLNSQGGIIFFGIKQDENKKRSIRGYNMSEKQKIQFRDDIFTLLKDVKPDVGKNCTVKWVPIKNPNTGHFGSGFFIPKVVIEKGAKDQLYSYYHGVFEKFAFKTENQFLLESDSQTILKIFRNKLTNPERPVYKIHDSACKEPLKGKPVYEDIRSTYEQNTIPYQPEEHESEFPSIMDDSKSNYNFENQKRQEKPKYAQKKSNKYIFEGISKEDYLNQFVEEDKKDEKIVELGPRIILVNIADQTTLNALFLNKIEGTEVFSQVEFNENDRDILKEIIAEIEYNDDQMIPSRKDSNILRFSDQEKAVQFWMKLKEMGLQGKFTSQY